MALDFCGVRLGQAGRGHPDCLGWLHGGRWSPGGSRVGRRLAGETDFPPQVESPDFSVLKQKRFLSKYKGGPQKMP